MEKQVPTIEIEVEGEKVLLYQWLTQEEEDKYNSILIGDVELDEKEVKKLASGEMKMKVSLARASDGNRYLMQSMVKSPSWEIVNSWKPTKRQELVDKINELRGKN